MLGLNMLSDFARTSEGQQAIAQWVSSDVTRLMVASGRELSRARAPLGDGPTAAAVELGRSLGAAAIVDFFEDPVPRKASGGALEGIRPTYGAEAILKEEGYAEGK